MIGITKRFGAVIANNQVDLNLAPGRIHALLGSNGAGKSTLMNVLFGRYRPSAGVILVDGRPVEFATPRDALSAGIGMLPQEIGLVPNMTVAENVLLGDRPSWSPGFRRAVRAGAVAELAARNGIPVEPESLVGDLSIDAQQQVAILRLLHRRARTLILDEPTSTLGPAEIARLFELLRAFREQGHVTVIITHKLREALEVADDVTVLRGGEVVLAAERAQVDETSLAHAMVGAAPTGALRRASPRPEPAAPILEVRGLVADGEHRSRAVDGCDLCVHPGEIVGLVGVEGNGQRELSEALFGVRRIVSGSVRIAGESVDHMTPAALHTRGVSMISESRLRWDVLPQLTLAENLALASVADRRLSRHGFLLRKQMRAEAERLLKEFGVVPADPDARMGVLSGGNQQKVVVARELARRPRLLIAAQPTRGLDIAATHAVHRRLLDLRAAECAILMITLNLDELFALADRVVVLFRGRIVLDAHTGELDLHAVGRAMAGVTQEAAA